VKLWSPYSAADSDHLLTTLDNHTDRVWALVAPNTSSTVKSTSSAKSKTSATTYPYPLISGAADATLTFWRDTTTQTATLASQRQTQRIEQDQLLQNYIFQQNYREAITLSLALEHPGRLLRVFQDVLDKSEEKTRERKGEDDVGPDGGKSIMGVKEVDDVLGSLDRTQLWRLLEHVRDWNTNARTAPVAQRILHCVLKAYPKGTFVDMAREKKVIAPVGDETGERKGRGRGKGNSGMQELLRALEVYTERHFKRMEELVDESYLIEYTLREMDEVAGGGLELRNGHARTGKGNGNGVEGLDGDVIMV
jgi:U3 small nucleolar RNA-associated protein 13